jgi:hypothetical protein
MAVHGHAPQPLQVFSKSISKEGQFTLASETLFRRYLAWNCSRMRQLSNMAISPNASQPLQDWTTAVNNEVYFTP